MTYTDISELTVDQLASLLGAWAEGSFAVEAGVELLVSHRVWLRREDFRRQLVDFFERGRGRTGVLPMAAIDWDWAEAFAQDAPCSSSERSVLMLAASLAGGDTEQSLLRMTSSLDDENATLVLAAISHRFGWHQAGSHVRAAVGPCVFPAAVPAPIGAVL